MLIKEIIQEDFHTDLVLMIQDLIVVLDSKGTKEISIEDFQKLLNKQGFSVSAEIVKNAIEELNGYGEFSADNEDPKSIGKITISGLPDDVSLADVPADVAGMAGDQAMQDINAELPA